MKGRLTIQPESNNKFLKLILPISFIIVASVVVTVLLKQAISSQDKVIGAYKVSEFILNGDTLKIGEGKYTKDPMLFFEFNNVSILSLDSTSYWGSYSMKSDSIFITLSKDFKNIKKIKAIISNDFKLVKGTTDKGEQVEINMSRVEIK